MMSKKDMLTLGVLAVGGVAVASSFAGGSGGDTGALEGKKGRAGGILGSQEGYGAAPTIYNLPAAGAVTFPEAPKFDIGSFLAPVNRGAAGVSSAGKAIKGAHKKVVESGFDVSTTFTGTPTTPAFAQKDIYHKAMLKELSLTTKKTPVPTKKKEVTGRAATPGRMGYGKSYAAAHGGN